jgi:hypothetical protein
MRNYVAVVFDDTGKAYEGLHALWQLDSFGDVTLYGTTVVHRDDLGAIQVDTKETYPAAATAAGIGIGTLLSALADTGLSLGYGQSAIIADANEDWTSPIDTRMTDLGGTVYRRAWSDVQSDVWFGEDYLYPYDYYLYPYEYIPSRYVVW